MKTCQDCEYLSKPAAGGGNMESYGVVQRGRRNARLIKNVNERLNNNAGITGT